MEAGAAPGSSASEAPGSTRAPWSWLEADGARRAALLAVVGTLLVVTSLVSLAWGAADLPVARVVGARCIPLGCRKTTGPSPTIAASA